MLGVCMRYARNKEEAEEILHEGFLRVFTYIQKFKGEGSFEGWIRKIMVNCAISACKKNTKLYAITSSINLANEPVDDFNVEAVFESKEIMALVQELPAAYRLVFNLYVFEGYKHREIAAMLNIAEGTSKSNLSDARNILRHALSKKTQIVKFK